METVNRELREVRIERSGQDPVATVILIAILVVLVGAVVWWYRGRVASAGFPSNPSTIQVNVPNSQTPNNTPTNTGANGDYTPENPSPGNPTMSQ